MFRFPVSLRNVEVFDELVACGIRLCIFVFAECWDGFESGGWF